MKTGEIISSIVSAVAVGLLGYIARKLSGFRNDFHRFMTEHMWLLATTTWTRDKVIRIMEQMNMPADNPPPSDLRK